MKLRPTQRLIGAALAAAMATTPLSFAVAQDHSLMEEEIMRVFRDLQAGRLSPKEASSECLLGIAENEDAEDLRQVMSTYLEVATSRAILAFCDALVEAVVQGSFEAEDFLPLVDGRDKQAEAFAAGRMLRQVYVTHNNLLSTPVSGEVRP